MYTKRKKLNFENLKFKKLLSKLITELLERQVLTCFAINFSKSPYFAIYFSKRSKLAMASNAPAPGFIGVVSTANKIPVLQQLSEFRKSQQNCIFSKRNFLLSFRDPPYLMNACSLDWSHPGVTGIRTWCAQDSAYESRYVQSCSRISFTGYTSV